jgi:hypothetical protein
MILDSRNEFADATALSTSGTGLQLVGNVIDTGAAARDLGEGEDLYLVVQVDTAVTSAGAATVDFQLASDAAAAIATDGSATVHASTGDIGKATLVAGYQRAICLPKGSTYERYVGILANVGTAAVTAGKVNVFLTKNPKGWTAYNDAVN